MEETRIEIVEFEIVFLGDLPWHTEPVSEMSTSGSCTRVAILNLNAGSRTPSRNKIGQKDLGKG